MKKNLLFALMLLIGLTLNFSYAFVDSEVETKAKQLEIAVNAIFENPAQKEKYYDPIKRLFIDCSKNSKKEVIKRACIILVEDFDERFGWNGSAKNDIKIKVVKVVDWDTINVLLNWESTPVRLIGVDSPENTTKRYGYTECYGAEASNYLEKILNWQFVSLEYDQSQWQYDSYNRILAYVFLNWENINERIIKNWYWWEYTYNKPYKYQSDFKNAQTFAKNNNYWLRNTCKWERVPLKDDNTTNDYNWKIKWNISSNWEKIYHIPGCSHYDKTVITVSKWEKWFSTETEAKTAWWRACID